MEANAKALFDFVFPPHSVYRDLSHEYTVVDGFYIEANTGVLMGRHLELDNNTGSYSPIYYYNRSWRFIGLFSLYAISLFDQSTTLRYFESLEKAWEDTKSKYKRVYFLTQKLILQEITKRLSISSTQPPKRPISDIRRYKAQLSIFNDLWKIVITNKCPNYISEASNSLDSTLRTVRYP